jgi:glyoxylase-like metal-dependent hydrolase (beta-lactamase superfamily II)
MATWRIGDVSITRIIETEDDSMTASVVLPDAKPENVLPIGWLQPHFIDAEGRLISSIFALLVLSQGKRIVIDTCLGNDKPRIVPQWNQRQGAFLADIATAGFPRESVDFVVCTHLHPDHVGWNTVREDGRWVPTFPNARYLFGRKEWDYWKNEAEGPDREVRNDSVRPVLEAGLADLVESDHQLTSDVCLEPTPGHTPGHVSVRISSKGAEAVITGDLMHHPVQCADPRICSRFDYDPAAAQTTRAEFLKRYDDGRTLVLGTHFAAPAAGKFASESGRYRLRVA